MQNSDIAPFQRFPPRSCSIGLASVPLTITLRIDAERSDCGASDRGIERGKCKGGMEQVLGIGGFYFRAKDPVGLARWYTTCLGVDLYPQGGETLGWTQQGLRLPLHPSWETAPVSPAESPGWMLTFRVRDLESMVRQLRTEGVIVDVDTEDHSAGRLARFADPEGNVVAIWELHGSDARE